MKSHILCFFLFISFSSSSQTISKWFNNETIDCTVLLEKEVAGQFVPHGTGFLIEPYKSKDPIIVTCDHVLKNANIYMTFEVNESFRNRVRSLPKLIQQNILKILNTDGYECLWNVNENFLRIRVPLKKDSSLFVHPSGLDIAAFKSGIPGTMTFKDSTFKIINAKTIGKSRISLRQNVLIGDDVYFIGFPFGIGTPEIIPNQQFYSTSVPRHGLRKGVVSWISSDYDEFLLDALSFGGNSGSPVFQINYEDQKPPHYLIGIIVGHLGDSTGNFGLARCLSISEINKVIQLADK